MYINESQLFLSLIGITIVVTCLIGMFVYGMIRQYRFYTAQQEAINRKRLQELDRYRAELAATLQTEASLLAGVRYTLGEIETNTQKHTQNLEEVRGYLDNVLSTIAGLCNALSPACIAEKGPLYALEEYRENLDATPAMEIDIIPMEFKGLTGEQSLHLYQMLVEIMKNAIAHSEASKLVISGEQTDSMIILRAADNGKGFSPDSFKPKRNLGLDDLELRAKIIGAELLLDTGEGKGTSYTINLPVKK